MTTAHEDLQRDLYLAEAARDWARETSSQEDTSDIDAWTDEKALDDAARYYPGGLDGLARDTEWTPGAPTMADLDALCAEAAAAVDAVADDEPPAARDRDEDGDADGDDDGLGR